MNQGAFCFYTSHSLLYIPRILLYTLYRSVYILQFTSKHFTLHALYFLICTFVVYSIFSFLLLFSTCPLIFFYLNFLFYYLIFNISVLVSHLSLSVFARFQMSFRFPIFAFSPDKIRKVSFRYKKGEKTE